MKKLYDLYRPLLDQNRTNNRIILHVCHVEKFIPAYIQFINENFDQRKHIFFIFGDQQKYPLINNYENVYLAGLGKFDQLMGYIKLVSKMFRAKKIILHGLFNIRIIQILFFMPWFLKKCYWTIWGGDLYVYQKRENTWASKKREFYRRLVIKNLGYFVTQVEGDYNLAKQWYKANGEWRNCFMYPSNLYKEYPLKTKKNRTINIQVGNSADPSNNHIEILEKLRPYKKENIRIFVPLSYGDLSYAEDLITFAKLIFNEKFIPLMNFMPTKEYYDFLSKIDIAIFNHKRQQAMGNIISLLSMGKKVYLRNDISSWKSLTDLELTIFSLEDFSLKPLDESQSTENIKKIAKAFSREKLIIQLNEMFNE